MRLAAGPLAGIAAALVLAGGCAASAQPDRCSRESLPLDGGAIAVTLCVSGEAAAGRIQIAETYARGSASVSRAQTIDVVAGADATRALNDVPLDPLGVRKSLHVTIVYRDGQATVEHAMLLPGAIVLK